MMRPKIALFSVTVATLLAICAFSVHADQTTNPSTSQVVLKAQSQAQLASQLDGKIQSVPKQEGDRFFAHEPLVIFDCTVHDAQLHQAKAHFEAKQTLHNSNLRMQKAKAVSQVELAQSRAELAQAKADLKIKQHQVDLCEIKAPFDGQLVKRYIYPHESVRRGQPLVDVLDNRNLDIELIVPSQWLAWISEDEPFTLHVEETNKQYKAHVTKILGQIDAVSQSVRLLGKLDSQHNELISGMSGRADFHLRRKQ